MQQACLGSFPVPGFRFQSLAMLLWFTLTVCAGGAQEEPAGFEEIAHVGSPALERAVDERGGRLEIQGDELVRLRGQERAVLGHADAEGPGELRDLASDPAGLTFVAGANGVYATSPEVRVLDRLALLDGAPPGSPTSVHVDAARRLWVATDEAFGCLDPSFYFGRTIEVPGPGPYRVLGGRDDGVVVVGAQRTWLYRPEVGTPPTITDLTLDGSALARDELLELDFGEELALTATGTATGGPVYRYRVDLHHVWLRLEDVVPGDIEPGSHTLDVATFDRDLRVSEPFRIRLRVDYPFYYQKTFVVGLAAGLAGLLFLAFWTLGSARGTKRLWRAVVSTVLVLTLALQVLAGAIPHARGWPFIGYSMYTESLDVGHIAYNAVLVGLDANGQHRTIDPGALGVAADNRWQVLGPLIRGGDEVNANAVAKYNGDRPTWTPIVRLQVWAKRWLRTENGDRPISQMILSDYVVPEEDR